jgi:two-component sensor histidine kinase
MKTVYESEKQEQTIEIQKANLEASNAVIELQRTKSNFLSIAVVFVMLLGTVLLIGYVNKTRRNRMLVQQKIEIERQNSERELLLKEIHHRVKNNLQVISSLLSMQSRSMKDGDAKTAVREGQSRIKSMSLIHQKLYSEDNLSKINMKDYIEELSDFLFKSYKPGVDIHKKIESDDLLLDVDVAMPLGLIINELISNALKYAFDPKTEGMVRVSLQKDNNDFVLNISDSGKGLPLDFKGNKTMGMNLVNILVEQLDGSMHINQVEGTSFTITFKDKRAA